MRRILAALFLLLSFTTANAASRVWVSEYANLGGPGPAQIAALPSIAIQSTLDISGGAQTSAAFNAQTKFIRVICEVQCAVRGDGTTATTSSILLPALGAEYFGVQPGATISVIAAP
jgi:hypothetical protein